MSEPAADRWLPSLRVLLTLIVMIPVAAASFMLITIASITAHASAEQTASDVMDAAAARASQDIHAYLVEATRVSDRYAQAIARGVLRIDDLASLRQWQQLMSDELRTTPEIASVCFGNAEGDATWLSRVHGRIEYGISDRAQPDGAVEYVANTDGSVDFTKPIRRYQYDPRSRPWYAAALSEKTGGGVWTAVYFWFGGAGSDSETGTGYARAIRDEHGKVRGVLVVDVTLSAMSEFLRRLPLAQRGAAFITDDTGALVASSHGSVNSSDARRLLPAESDSMLVRTAAVAAGNAVTGQTVTAHLTDEPARVRVVALEPSPGVHWRLFTVLRESSFLGHVRAMRARAIGLAVVVVAAALLLGIGLSRRLSGPLLRLAHHIVRVGGGEFDARLKLGTAKELRSVAEQVNNMAGGLRHRLELEKSLALASHVQQSLLPDRSPKIDHLDIAGRSHYCDSTGGDYYDFIDVVDIPGKRVLIAVGDVTGHGIGAALLMATARGSIRASVAEEASLGDIISRANHVLAADARHGLFMTLSLVLIDPQSREIRYASAGHDPPILFDPAAGTFRELEGGDFPMGVMDKVVYQEYCFGPFPDEGVLVIGTDGIWEAPSAGDGALFGKDRLRDLIRANGRQSAETLAKSIEESLEKYVQPERPKDDVTFVIVRRQP